MKTEDQPKQGLTNQPVGCQILLRTDWLVSLAELWGRYGGEHL